MADGILQPFSSLLEWPTFSITLDTAKLMAGDTRQLDRLYTEAASADRQCRRCTSCEACTRLGLIQRMRALEQVRPWLAWDPSSAYSAIGLLLVELNGRRRGRSGWFQTVTALSQTR